MNASSTVSMIKISGLKKTFGETEAIKGISFDIPKGQVVGFLGPNGAGKSTTMRILTGYTKASAGTAVVGGVDVSENPVEAQRKIGYLAENNPLYDDMMVYEYLNFIADVRDIPKNERRQKIASAANKCGIVGVIGKDIGTLSKGFRQRVGLAQAIVHDPELLILDEPTSGLDPNQIIEIRSLIKELGKEKTILMSTHILGEVQSTCSRVLIINNGTLVADDSPDQLNAREGGTVYVVLAPKNGSPVDANRVKSLFSQIGGVTRVEKTEGQAENETETSFSIKYQNDDPRKALFQHIVEENLVLLEMRRKEVSLEETFRKLTTA